MRIGDVVCDCRNAPDLERTLVKSGALIGTFAHSDRVLTEADEKAKCFKQTGADAVEMESSAVVSACRSRNIPVAVLRVISDTSDESLPLDFNHFSKADGSLSMPRLLMGIALSPSSITKLIKFNRQLDVAARQLGTVLERFLLPGDFS